MNLPTQPRSHEGAASSEDPATGPQAPRRRGRPGRWLLVGVAVLAVGLAWLRFGDPAPWLDGAPSWVHETALLVRGETPAEPDGARAPAPVPVQVAQVAIRSVPVEFRSVGTVEAVETVAIRSRVDGVVEKILVHDGALVKAGDLLVELDARPIEAQIDQQEANIRRDRAQLDNAQVILGRAQDLARRGATARQSLDDASTQVEALTAGLAASEAQLRALQLERSFHRVTAPFDGRIGRLAVSPGAIVRGSDTGGTIATLNQVDPIYVAVGIPQNLLGELSQALEAGTARIEVPLPGSTETRTGPVTMVENQVERGTGLVTVRARIKNDDQRLWPGTVLDARLILREDPDALVVPSGAVQISQTGSFLFVIDQDQKARVQPVQVDRTSGDYAVLASGPPAGTTVVTEGQIRLTDGAAVHVEDSQQGLEARL
jgi:multidrug efflux system membrane fusion protein